MHDDEDPRIRTAGWRELGLAFVLFLAAPVIVLQEPLFDSAILVTEHEGSLPYHLAVRNAQRYGVLELGGVPLLTAGEQDREHFRFWTHHPTALFAALHGATLCLGEGPAAGRWLMLLCQALTAVLAHALLRRRLPVAPAALAGLLLVCARGFGEFGLLVEIFCHPLLLLTCLAVLAWVRFDERPSPSRFFAVVVTLLAAGSANWQALLLAGFFVIDRVVVQRRLRTPTWVLPALAIALFAGWTAWTDHFTEGTVAFSAGGLGSGDTLSTFAARINEGPAFLDQPRLGPVDGARRMTRTTFAENLGLLALVLVVLGGLDVLWRAAAGRLDRVDRATLLLFLSPFTFLLMFSRGAIIHPFWTLGCLAGIAMMAGAGAGRLEQVGRRVLGARGAAGLTVLLGLIVLGAEILATRAGWEERGPQRRESQARHDLLGRAVREHLREHDHLVVTGHEWRAELLAWQLDRTVHGNLSAIESLEALRRAHPGRLLVALPFEEAGRLPRLVASLRTAPIALISPPDPPILLFDLREPPSFTLRLPPDETGLLEAAASRLPPAPERLELADGPEGKRLRIVPSTGRVVLFAGTRADHLAPLHDLEAAYEIPLDRFPPGRWFLAAATKKTAAGAENAVLSSVTEPLELEVPLTRTYVLRAVLAAVSALLAGAALYALLIARSGKASEGLPAPSSGPAASP